MLFQGGKLSAITFMFATAICIYLISGRWSGIRRSEGSRELLNSMGGGKLMAGQHLQMKLVFYIPGIWPLPYVRIKETLVRKNGETIVQTGTIVPDWARRGELVYSTPPLRRGTYRFDNTEMTTTDIFGLIQHKGQSSMPYYLTVIPETVDLQQWTQFQQILRGMQHRTLSMHAHRETTQINGVREYIYGDRLSRIHWNATAKTGAWKSKEFEREALPKTIVVLDRMQRAYYDTMQYELAISIAASLLRYGEEQHLPMGLLSLGYDNQLFQAGVGGEHFDGMMMHLVDAEADGYETIEAGLQQHAARSVRGSMFIMVSPQRGKAIVDSVGWLKRHGMNACHILVESPNAAFRQENADWISKLHALGVIGFGVSSLRALPHAVEGVIGNGK